MAKLMPQTWVLYQNERCKCVQILNSEVAVLEHPDGQLKVRRIVDITPTDEWAGLPSSLIDVHSRAWHEAREILNVVRPIVQAHGRTRMPKDTLEAACASLDCSLPTLYRYIAKFRRTESMNAFHRKPRTDRGASRLPAAIEAIVTEKIEKLYLRKKPNSFRKLYEGIERACRQKALPAPSKALVYRRVANLPPRLVLERREGADVAKRRHDPIKGSFPGAEAPFMVYQIDHSPIDLMFVDDTKARKPIGRVATLTTVIDICTRMVAGFCISMDKPSVLTAGIALGNAILSKDKLLAKLGLTHLSWPMHGVPAKIHTDNAREFIGSGLERSCEIYGIVNEQRPKARPHYGGHVERSFRTFMDEVHDIPGTTYSNIFEKADYDSEGNAILTLKEFELWFTLFIVGVYHNGNHEGLEKEVGFQISPLNMLNRMVAGTEEFAGTGMPIPITDELQVRLNFLPFHRAIISREGVEINRLIYKHPILNRYIGFKGEDGKGKKYTFVQDPRDVSEIYFLDEQTDSYHAIPWAYRSRKPLSKWEWNATKKGKPKHVDSDTILRTRDSMEAIVVQARKDTRQARAHEAKIARHQAESIPAQRRPAVKQQPAKPLRGTFKPSTIEDE